MARARLESWAVSDAFWERVKPLIPQPAPRPRKRKFVRKPGGGRKPKDPRVVFEAIVYVLRTGCQWKALPSERFGSASSIHKRFLQWEKEGVFQVLWQAGLAEYDEMEGIAWRWQSIDGVMLKAPLAHGGKNGSKRMLLVDAPGVPLSIIVTAANRHDVTQLVPTLNAVVVARPGVRAGARQHLLCGRRRCRQASAPRHHRTQYTLHVRSRGEESKAKVQGKRARRWVVEVAHSWFNRFRKLLVRYEKTDRSYMALKELAAAVIAFRKVPAKVNIIYG